MIKKLSLLAAAVSVLFILHLQSREHTDESYYYQLFDKAEKLFNGEATATTDSVALSWYYEVATHLQQTAANAKKLYDCYERMGILKQGLGYTADASLKDYYTSLQLQRTYSLGDSVLYRLLLSTGYIHYINGLFDSSVYYLSWAERIINIYPSAGLAGDLYNSLGALYSESGDYMQSSVYFTKALEITRQTRPDLQEAIFAMSVNIATGLKLSGHTDEALRIYISLLDKDAPSLALLNNIAGIYLNKHEPDSALYYLHKVSTATGNYSVAYYNAKAQAFMQKEDIAAATVYLDTAAMLYTPNSLQTRSNAHGATCKYLGDLKLMENKPAEALGYYQQAIIQYNYKFRDTNVYVNPGNFIGDFASYNLFDALIAKANCFALLNRQTNDTKFFKAAQSTYDSAFVLADYIKKSIDNDEARLFITDKVFEAYRQATDFIIAANKNNDKALTVHALEWISKSRAASLAISLKENTIKQFAGLPDSLLQQEKNIKINISRLKLRLQQAADSGTQAVLVSSLNTAALQLQSLNNDYKKYPAYYRQKFAADSTNINSIQKNILDEKTTVICSYQGVAGMQAFVIKYNNIIEVKLNSDSAFNKMLDSYMQGLSYSIAGKTYNTTAAKYLYKLLLQPLQQYMNGTETLIIIPDRKLINVPFEALITDDDKYVIEDFAVSYQYALPFLQKGNKAFDKSNALAIAPFAAANSKSAMAALPFSAEEIKDFPLESRLMNAAATKENFINSVPAATLLHLATHAVVDYETPANSYIAFYNKGTADSSNKIFAHELYNLQLPKAQLVFLSACETGSGKVSQSEGALSLSRAFAYAGCPNIITSLWKAEDQSTAYISKRFYDYTEKGYTYTKALQQAKKDLLHDANMSQYRAPQYWSHLILIGEVQQQDSNTMLWLILAAVILLTSVLLYHRVRKTKLNAGSM